jgi:5-methylcytosine-specific restriction enzyme subunit McrC
MLLRRQRPVIVRVLEHGRVVLPQALNTARTRERLEEAALRAGKAAFEMRGRSLYAKGIVGVVDLGDLVVELLPKTHDVTTPEEGRTFLTDLLRFTSGGDGLSVSDAAVSTGDRSLLEVILAWAARTAMINAHQGLPRRYMPREEVSTAVRGRIDLRRVALAKPGKAFELVVRHAPLTNDNPITRIIRWLVTKVSRVTRVNATRQRCQQVLEGLAEVADVTPAASDFDRIVLQPLEIGCAPLLRLARSLIEQSLPDPTRAGPVGSVAVLFTLHDLFESALRKVFREGLQSHGIALRLTTSHLLHAEPADGRLPILRLRPDFRFLPSGSGLVPAIGDAKWKRILTADGDVRPSEDDAYQLTAYLTALQGSVGFLFCPLFGIAADSPIRTTSWRLTGG